MAYMCCFSHLHHHNVNIFLNDVTFILICMCLVCWFFVKIYGYCIFVAMYSFCPSSTFCLSVSWFVNYLEERIYRYRWSTSVLFGRCLVYRQHLVDIWNWISALAISSLVHLLCAIDPKFYIKVHFFPLSKLHTTPLLWFH